MARRSFFGRLVGRESDSPEARRTAAKKDYRPRVESLDQRLLLSTFVVNSPGDAGPGTLRDAITQSNADSGQPNTINFTLDAASRTITLASPLPAVTAAVTIDGTSDPATPLVTLSGSAGATDGLSIQAAGTTVKGLALGNFAGTALTLKADGAVVQGNDFGTAGNGTSPAPNGTGIRVSGSNETIGGAAAGTGNLLANNGAGIVVADHAHGNTIASNTLTANGGPAITIVNSDRNTITGNSIAASNGPGILLDPRSGDVAPNALLPAPVLAPPTGTDTASATVTGSIQGTPSTTGYRVEFFANANGGPAAQGDAYLGSVTVATDANGAAPFSFSYTPVPGKPALTATVTDPSGNTSAFSGPNAAPVNQMPGPQSVDQDLPLVFSPATGNAIAVADPLRPDNTFQIALTASSGTLTLSSLNGLTGTGNGTASLSYSGNLAQIDAALNGLTYRPPADVPGTTTLTLTSTSVGSAGLGASLSKSSSTTVEVRSIRMPPNVLSSYTSLNQQSNSGLVITPSPYGPRNVTSFQVTQISHGTLYQNDGVTPIQNGAFINLQQAAAGLKFTPDNGFIGVGSFSVQASRDGTANGLSGPSALETITVNRVPITTTLSSSDASSTRGQSVTFSATVSPGVAGTINFMDGANSLGTVTLANGAASLSVANLSVGSHSITAVYSGDQGRAGSASPPIIQTVTAPVPIGTTTTLSASSGSLTVGQPVTLTASVSPKPPGGTVTFLDGATILGTQPLSGTTASLTIPVLTAGSHSLTAIFNGSGNDAVSQSSAVIVSVQNPTSSQGGSSNGGGSGNTGGTTTGNSGGTTTGGTGGTTTGNSGGTTTGNSGGTTTGGGTQTAQGTGGGTVVQMPTTTMVSVSIVKAHRRRYAAITANVSSSSGQVPTSGVVTFFLPSGQPSQTSLVNGIAVLNVPVRGRPKGSVTAIFNGNTAFQGSQSLSVPLFPRPIRGPHRR